MSGAIVASGIWIALAIYWGLSKVADAIRENKPNASGTTESEARP